MLTRTVADSIFLSQFGTDRLPELYLLSAGVVTLTSMFYGGLVARIGLRLSIVSTLVSFAVISAALPALLRNGGDSLIVLTCAYLLAQIRGSLGTIQFATVLNEQLGNQQHEKVIGIVGAGATLAGLTAGGVIAMAPAEFPIEHFLTIAALLDLATLVPLLALRSTLRARRDIATGHNYYSRGAQRPTWRAIFSDSYLVLITCAVALCIVATTLVEFQWKVSAAERYGTDTQAMARYFGLFYGVIYLLTGSIQLFGTSRILRRFGIASGLVTLPAAILVGASLSVVAASPFFLFVALTLSKGTDLWRRSLFDPAIQLVYWPLEKTARRQAITFVAGMAKPFSEALAASAVVLFTLYFAPQRLSVVVILVTLVWVVVCVRLASRFKRANANAQKGEQSRLNEPLELRDPGHF